jgi:hypothetical protein
MSDSDSTGLTYIEMYFCTCEDQINTYKRNKSKKKGTEDIISVKGLQIYPSKLQQEMLNHHVVYAAVRVVK